MKFDLHTHTDNSDGTYSPIELIDLAIKKGLSGIAITDHDNTDGVDIAIKYAEQLKDFKIIPGIEFGCVYEGKEVHILGYFIDYNDNNFIKLTKKLKDSRMTRGVKIISRLNDLEIEISMKDVNEFSKADFIGRPHIARALMKKGYVNNISEAFEKYLGINSPAYVERYKISVEEVINLIKDIKGISVLAHPGLIGDNNIVNYCISKGINGLECIYPQHSGKEFKYYSNKAKDNNLLITGGSDFHGDRCKNILLGKYYVGIDTIKQMEMMK